MLRNGIIEPRSIRVKEGKVKQSWQLNRTDRRAVQYSTDFVILLTCSGREGIIKILRPQCD